MRKTLTLNRHIRDRRNTKPWTRVLHKKIFKIVESEFELNHLPSSRKSRSCIVCDHIHDNTTEEDIDETNAEKSKQTKNEHNERANGKYWTKIKNLIGDSSRSAVQLFVTVAQSDAHNWMKRTNHNNTNDSTMTCGHSVCRRYLSTAYMRLTLD